MLKLLSNGLHCLLLRTSQVPSVAHGRTAWQGLAGIALAGIVLIACGGGGSSSGGGDSTETEGVFVGDFSVTISTSDDVSNDTGNITFLVEPHRITRDPMADGTAGAVDGSSFAIINTASTFLNDVDLDCSGFIQLAGEIEPGRIEATIFSSNLVCNGLPFNVSGTARADYDRAAL